MRSLEVRVQAVLRVPAAIVVKREGLERLEPAHAAVRPRNPHRCNRRASGSGRAGRRPCGGRPRRSPARSARRTRTRSAATSGAESAAGQVSARPTALSWRPSVKAVEILATGREAVDLDVHGMREVRPRHGSALLRDAREAGIFRDFPGDFEDRMAKRAGVEGFRREPRPDHEPVRRGIARGDAELERRGREARPALAMRERHQRSRAGCGCQPVELAARDAASHARPLRCRRRPRSRPAAVRPAKRASSAARCA